ncbi:MAG: molybdopterin converting factor subunit 1 [Proteobacteria bacterium]|nr:molybdopterin converting factor subunit 1 [Pseudomonadota bacterium]MBU6424930.1 molybdopterin converting factor subunit 1 [Rhodospirillales bacterium]
MRILYFAWLRERIGKSSEELDPPPGVDTPRALIAWLRTQGPGYANAFSDEKPVRCAIDQEFQPLDAPLGSPKEIGFFPPVTGG